MKVLLVEPFTRGHTTVILRYCEKILPKLGVEVCRPDAFSPDVLKSPAAFFRFIEEVAIEKKCDLIHVLTVDYFLKAWALPSFPIFRGTEIPIVGNLYNYNNLLSSLRAWPMRWLAWRGAPRRFFVSSSKLGDKAASGWQQRLTHFIPDPYDPDEFEKLSSEEARNRLGVANEPGKKVFLVFGTLDKRKGFDLVLSAFAALTDRKDWHLVCAGSLDRTELGSEASGILDRFVSEGRCTLFEGFVDEAIVSPLFHGADYVVTAYPLWYVISSGNHTRACAAGKPSICGNHGEVGEFVSRTASGLTFVPENVHSLRDTLVRALDISLNEYQLMARSAMQAAIGKDLLNYGRVLVDGYSLVMNSTR